MVKLLIFPLFYTSGSTDQNESVSNRILIHIPDFYDDLRLKKEENKNDEEDEELESEEESADEGNSTGLEKNVFFLIIQPSKKTGFIGFWV